MKLWGYSILRHIFVVRGEWVAHKAEGAYPDPSADVDITRQRQKIREHNKKDRNTYA